MQRSLLAALAFLIACDSTPAPLVRADPAITVNPEMIDFGSVNIGLNTSEDVVVTNPGRGDLVIDIARIEGEGKAAFTLSAPDIASIPAGRNKLAKITFAPMAAGRFNATLQLYHNIPGKDPVQVPLTGLGTMTTSGCVDRDMDGFGDGCPMPDCNDNDAMIHPGATERCNNVDDNCNRLIDDGVLIQQYFRDNDGDGYASDSATPVPACTAPPGHVTRQGDCNDNDNLIHPGAKEPCDGKDNDCDMIIDNGVALTEFWPDDDGDGFATDTSTAVRACANPPRHVRVRGDCDDTNAAIKPGAMEVCNGVDDNCNDMIDEGVALTEYFPDVDGDGYGSMTATSTRTCRQPPNTATRRMDCDDTNRNIHPGGMEICSGGADEDCDTLIDMSDPDCAPMTCTAQDQCGLTSNRMSCPFLGGGTQTCARVCDNTGECMGQGSCRPLPGSTQFGFCAQTGTVAHGLPCRSTASCTDGICILGKCSKLCQTQADCTGGEECGVGLWNMAEIGGASQLRLTSTCRPVEGGRQPIGGSCKVDAQNADSALCNTGHCDFLPFGYQLSTNAPCAPLCAGSGDCGPQQVCGLIYHGQAENPPIPSTGEGAGRYFEGIFGCYTPVIDLGLGPQPVPPGTGAMGTPCTPSNARQVCRSHQCAQFISPNRCTDFCDEDADCRTPATSNWRCAFGELSLTGVYLQALQVADITKFTLVGVCAPP